MILKHASRIYLLLALMVFSFTLVADDAAVIHNQELISAAKKLPDFGTLQKKEKGFTYVKVDDAFIHELYSLIEEEEVSKPPYFRRADAPGAHISVLYEAEVHSLGLTEIPDIGKVFHFEIMRLVTVHVKQKKLYLIQVSSPELEQYRASLGLSPKLHNHEFHITIAQKSKGKSF
jgi:hypothetical protein